MLLDLHLLPLRAARALLYAAAARFAANTRSWLCKVDRRLLQSTEIVGTMPSGTRCQRRRELLGCQSKPVV
jgi:hypothetical protein